MLTMHIWQLLFQTAQWQQMRALSVNISIQKNHQMQFYLLNMSLLFLRIFDICFVGGVCNFLGSVSPQQKFEAMDRPVLQLCVTAQFYLASRGKYILKAWGWADPKDAKRSPQLNFGSSFYFFFLLPWACPM